MKHVETRPYANSRGRRAQAPRARRRRRADQRPHSHREDQRTVSLEGRLQCQRRGVRSRARMRDRAWLAGPARKRHLRHADAARPRSAEATL